jgi:hypothetical protein
VNRVFLSSRLPQPLAFTGSFHEVIWFAFDPGDKLHHIGVRQQGFDRIELPGQFGFSEQAMNLPVADPMQIFGVFAALGFGHQVMRVPLARWDLALTQGADQIDWQRAWSFQLK